MNCFKVIILIFIILLNLYCSKESEDVTYKSITIKNPKTQFITKDIFSAFSQAKFENYIYFKSTSQVWVADVDKKEAKLLFKKGIGPNEVYLPAKLIRDNDKLYINSFMPLKYIYCYSLDSTDNDLYKMHLPVAISFDDFYFPSPNQMIMAYVYWDEGDLVRIYDLKSGKFRSIGKRTFSPIMMKFNVNAASIYVLKDLIYVIQTIVPEIQVMSIPECKVIDKIKLSPPFYKPMPSEYNVKKLDRKEHLAWNELWTPLYDIKGKTPWILITYKTILGDKNNYFYELINIENRNKRFYIESVPYLIYDFNIAGEQIDLEMCQEANDGVLWLKAEANLL